MATCDIKLRTHPTKKATALRSHLLLDMEQILYQDVSDAVLQVADCELKAQESIDNDATNIFINNRPVNNFQRGRFSSSKQYVFRARMLFGATSQLVDAALEVMQLLRTLTRIRSGAAVQSYHIFLGNTANTSNPGRDMGRGISGLIGDNGLRDQVTENSMISIIGPNTIYGRKLYWNPAGGKTIAKRLPTAPGIKAILKGTKTGGFRGSATIHRDVKKRMARSVKWKALSFSDAFYVMPGFKIIGDKRVPAISIMLKASGRLN